MKKFLMALLIVAGLLTATIVAAAVQIFDGTGQYIANEYESRDIAEKRARQKAEQAAQKRAGVYLRTFSRSVNAELTDDEISAVTNDIISVSDVKITREPFEVNGEPGLIYKATLKASIDPDGIFDFMKRTDKDKDTIVQQNTQLQDAIEHNDKLTADLKEQYKRATTPDERERIRRQLHTVEREFLANEKLQEGNRLYYAKDYNGAINLFSEALELRPNWDWAYTNRGNAYVDSEQYERAIADYTKAIELNPNEELAYHNRGWIYYCFGQYERAIQDYSKAIQLKPNYALAYGNRGNAYANLGQHERAIADYDKAIQLNPNFAEAYNNRGTAYDRLKKYDQAIQDLTKAVAIEPNYADAYYNRGNIYNYILKQYERAISDYSKAIELNPNDAQAYNHRGNAYQALGDNAKAQADFAKAKALGYNR